jgi:hypothetical protein
MGGLTIVPYMQSLHRAGVTVTPTTRVSRLRRLPHQSRISCQRCHCFSPMRQSTGSRRSWAAVGVIRGSA